MKVPEDGEVVQFPERELDFDNDTLRGEMSSSFLVGYISRSQHCLGFPFMERRTLLDILLKKLKKFSGVFNTINE